MYDPKKVINLAMEMELNGKQFFIENAKKCQNLQSKRLFERLSEVELDHYDYLKKLQSIYDNTDQSKGDLEMPEELAEHFFDQLEDEENIEQNLEQSMIPDINILRMAYLLKQDFREFYLDMANNIEDEKLKSILIKFSNWADNHTKILKQEYDRLMALYMNVSWGG